MEDVNGDGEKDTVSLIYDGDLVLQVNDSSLVVYYDYEPPAEDGRWPVSIVQPGMTLVRDMESGKIAVSSVWATNKIGSTAELKLYEYDDSNIEQIWEMSEQMPAISTRWIGEEMYEAAVSGYGLKQQLIIPEKEMQWLKETQNDTIENVVSSENFLFPSTHTSFIWKDYDGDRKEELVTKQMVYFLTAPFYAVTLYTIYQVGENIQPLTAYLARDMKAGLLESVLNLGEVRYHEEDPAVSYLLSSGYSYEEIGRAMEQMQSEGILEHHDVSYVLSLGGEG